MLWLKFIRISERIPWCSSVENFWKHPSQVFPNFISRYIPNYFADWSIHFSEQSVNYSSWCQETNSLCMGLLPDTQTCGLRMRRECRERFPRHQFQRKPLVSDPGMHHGTCVTHVSWCMSGSLTSGGGHNVPSIPGACAARNFTLMETLSTRSLEI